MVVYYIISCVLGRSQHRAQLMVCAFEQPDCLLECDRIRRQVQWVEVALGTPCPVFLYSVSASRAEEVMMPKRASNLTSFKSVIVTTVRGETMLSTQSFRL
jgi:hypothetical protein